MTEWFTIDADRRDALWKWRWLGWRRSTPAFKASVALLTVAAAALLGKALRLF